MRVEVDVSAVHELTKEANASLRKQRNGVKKILHRHAVEARGRHGYRNRSFTLQESTFEGEIEIGPDEFSIEFGARAGYASFVERRGLQDIDGHARDAATEIDFYLDGEADRLGGI